MKTMHCYMKISRRYEIVEENVLLHEDILAGLILIKKMHCYMKKLSRRSDIDKENALLHEDI